jgi:hypothetical protein
MRSLFIGARLLVVLAVLAWPALAPQDARAASPPASPSATPTPEHVQFPIYVWIDHPLPATAPVGSLITVGFMLWDQDTNALDPNVGPMARLHPAGGEPGPFEKRARPNFPGHYVVSLEVPEGGPGTLEVGFSGMYCDSNGCSQGGDLLYPFGGVGPPPGTPPGSLFDAEITPLGKSVFAGQPVEIGMTLAPKTDWPDGSVKMPDGVFVIVRQARGADVGAVPAAMDPANPGSYLATITLPAAGNFTVLVAADAAASPGSTFDSSLTRITAEASVAPPSSGGEPPFALLGGGIAVAVVLLVVVRRVFADF